MWFSFPTPLPLSSPLFLCEQKKKPPFWDLVVVRGRFKQDRAFSFFAWLAFAAIFSRFACVFSAAWRRDRTGGVLFCPIFLRLANNRGCLLPFLSLVSQFFLCVLFPSRCSSLCSALASLGFLRSRIILGLLARGWYCGFLIFSFLPCCFFFFFNVFLFLDEDAPLSDTPFLARCSLVFSRKCCSREDQPFDTARRSLIV